MQRSVRRPPTSSAHTELKIIISNCFGIHYASGQLEHSVHLATTYTHRVDRFRKSIPIYGDLRSLSALYSLDERTHDVFTWFSGILVSCW